MEEKNNYLMYALAHQMVISENYELLHLNDQIKEVWLQKYENKVSTVIRITSQGFDWKNHLKKDIAQVFQKTKALKRYLSSKRVQVNNIYLTKHVPVDDWEMLQKPMQLKEKNPIKMNVYYVAEENYQEEKHRLQDDLNILLPDVLVDKTANEIEQGTNDYKRELARLITRKRKEDEDVFSYGKPRLIYALLVINLLMYFLLEMNGGSESIETLIKYGAKYNPAILMDGEWWRVVTSMFLHIGFIHLVMNMLAVYYLGSLVERIYGSWRFIIIYFLAGIGGGLASFAFTANVAAGASGALFGLFGALLFFGLIYRRLFFQTIGMNVLFLVGINIIFGLTIPQIDNSAHMGGLVAGFIASAIVHLPKKGKAWQQLIAFVIYTVMLLGLFFVGIENNENDPAYQLTRIEQLVQDNEYEEIVTVATKALEEPSDFEALLLFQRSYAYIELNELELAITDLEKSIQLEDDRPESFYNLALLYIETGEQDKAKESIEEAYALDPENEKITSLYEEITSR